MSHFFAVVIVNGDTPVENIEEAVTRLLAPYDENTKVERYKEYFDEETIKSMKRVYKTNSLSTLVVKMKDWSGNEGGIDEQGLYEFSTYNPQSKWDWWVIGGRWDGVILDKQRIDEEDGGFNFDADHHQLQYNMLPIHKLDHKLTSFALVTPDGEWHEKGRMGWFGVSHDDQEQEVWDAFVTKTLVEHNKDIIVGVDCHI